MNQAQLSALFAQLGARDPDAWAHSQVNEGIPQLARYVFLREAWRQVVAAADTSWVDAQRRHALASPAAPFAGIGHALERVLSHGASPADLTEIVRGMQVQLLQSLCYLLSDPGQLEPEIEDVTWALMQIDAEGVALAEIGGLHESVLQTDPTGREMRPETAA